MKIIPGHSIGDFKIGDNFFIHNSFENFKESKDGTFKSGFITIRIDEQGIINLIATDNGSYGNISTDKTFREIINEGAILLYDEFDQVFYLKNPEGLCIGKAYQNLNFEELLNSKIEYLNIYDINADKEFFIALKNSFTEISKDNLNNQV
jgi:hypothetical protein